MLTKKSFKSLLKSLNQNASNTTSNTTYPPGVTYASNSYSNTAGWSPGQVIPYNPQSINVTPSNTNTYTTYTWPSSGMSMSGVSSGWPPSPDAYWPWSQWTVTSEQERELITDFKSRHPDFDTFQDEINLITLRKPGLLNTPLFISLIYELAKDIKKLLDNYTDPDKIEEILDGKTEETTG